MSIAYQDATVTLYAGDCLDVLRTLPDNSIDAVVTDPPYGLEFMGREWDGADGFRRSLNAADAGRDNVFGRTSRTSPEYRALHTFQQWCEQWTRECLRVLKPGGHLLAFGGTRTWHRLACAVEDAGFEVRDSIAWLYGSGFPKSLDVSKAIDRAAGAEREVVGAGRWAAVRGTSRAASQGASNGGTQGGYNMKAAPDETAPATDAARTWKGWGTALKPAFEPVVVARKPLTSTVAGNVLAWGTGALNVDACRIGTDDRLGRPQGTMPQPMDWGNRSPGETFASEGHPAGRWPANVVLDEVMAAELDKQSGDVAGAASNGRKGVQGVYEDGIGEAAQLPGYGDSGGASRFMYVAKADASERVRVDGIAHPTVKPLALMRWLVRLVTPPGGTVLEPFAGSGTTVEACILEGFHCVAIEREADYLPLIRQRINRRRDPIQAVKGAGEDGGLFDLLDEEEAS